VPYGSGAYGADNDELVQASQEFDPLNDHESVSTELSWITSVVNETIYRPCIKVVCHCFLLTTLTCYVEADLPRKL